MVKTPPHPCRRASISLLTLGIAKLLKWKTRLSFQSLSGEKGCFAGGVRYLWQS